MKGRVGVLLLLIFSTAIGAGYWYVQGGVCFRLLLLVSTAIGAVFDLLDLG